MLRISKLTDYAIVLLAHFARRAPGSTCNARELSEATGLPFPAVGKVLKTLAQAGLLVSHRGAKGGYTLARPPAAISVVEIIEALEGPIALMACSAGPGHCGQESTCSVRDPWQTIHGAVRGALAGVTLGGLVQSAGGPVQSAGGPVQSAGGPVQSAAIPVAEQATQRGQHV